MTYIYEEELEVPLVEQHKGLLAHLRREVTSRLSDDRLPVRLAVTAINERSYQIELGVLVDPSASGRQVESSIFHLRPRRAENYNAFNAVFVIPTGIGSVLGGHAGDANATAKLFASACDTLITHPNVVNASDVNELPDNGLYVEGSIISRLLMGTVALQPIRANRVLTVLDAHPDHYFSNITINAVSAARASYGLDCPHTVLLNPPVRLEALYAASGRAVGRVDRLEGLFRVLQEYQGQYDAVALSTQIAMPLSYRTDYYLQRGDMINPWGGVEAIFTHTLSTLYDVPTAHAPMELSRELSEQDLGIVDPRMAAEAISTSYFLCVLKGLQRAPRIISDLSSGVPSGSLTAADISCLIIPDNCVGLPTLAALEQGIPVIAIRENHNIMRNDLTALPWQKGQLHMAENSWEAVGIMTALKAGIDPATTRRPLAEPAHTTKSF